MQLQVAEVTNRVRSGLLILRGWHVTVNQLGRVYAIIYTYAVQYMAHLQFEATFTAFYPHYLLYYEQ